MLPTSWNSWVNSLLCTTSSLVKFVMPVPKGPPAPSGSVKPPL